MGKKQQAITQYFRDIWLGISSTWKGMAITLRYFFKPKVTMKYPEEKPEIPAGHRGMHTYDEDKCNLCMACVNACPVDCIVIEAIGRGKDSMKKQYNIDYSKCMFCNLCCEACRTQCLFLGEHYDMAAAEKAGCLVHFARTKTPEELEAFAEQLRVKEEEKKAKAEAAKAAEAGKGSDAGEAK